ncbi:hypothetical protein KDL01_09670 [Actinospica durhamensis]|uniref:Uncharacterized protein n=1 Tax=Actinospica durhamensis TaxID=1508375 RepID=A0A941IN34_9ACTN|nr:hypothetical protein [Actinospica durhamensis]MBR7833534.1 hypothetical protein [Actinospica durhamensis]
MLITRSIALFLLAAVSEIGGCRLVWLGVREHRGWWPAVRRRASRRACTAGPRPSPSAGSARRRLRGRAGS